MSVYGPIVPDTVIEDLLLDTLKEWIEPALGEVARTVGEPQDFIRKPLSWGVPEDRFQRWPTELTPHIAVMSGGTEGDPEPDGEGLYWATYRIEVTAVVSTSKADSTERLSKYYATAIELALLQHPPGAPIEDIVWRGHEPEDLGDTDRSMVAMTCRFSVICSNVLQRLAGPDQPEDDPRDPAGDLPTVQEGGLGVVGSALPRN